jgi:hypothetical protein
MGAISVRGYVQGAVNLLFCAGLTARFQRCYVSAECEQGQTFAVSQRLLATNECALTGFL